jgi:hypothetical protein
MVPSTSVNRARSMARATAGALPGTVRMTTSEPLAFTDRGGHRGGRSVPGLVVGAVRTGDAPGAETGQVAGEGALRGLEALAPQGLEQVLLRGDPPDAEDAGHRLAAEPGVERAHR